MVRCRGALAGGVAAVAAGHRHRRFRWRSSPAPSALPPAAAACSTTAPTAPSSPSAWAGSRTRAGFLGCCRSWCRWPFSSMRSIPASLLAALCAPNRIGKSNGIGYFVVAGAVIVPNALGWGDWLPTVLGGALAWLLVATTLLSMGERLLLTFRGRLAQQFPRLTVGRPSMQQAGPAHWLAGCFFGADGAWRRNGLSGSERGPSGRSASAGWAAGSGWPKRPAPWPRRPAGRTAWWARSSRGRAPRSPP